MGESEEKVVAVTKIPRGARTGYFSLDSVSFAEEVQVSENLVQVGIWTNGEIQPLNTSQIPSFWPRLIKIAPDCHVQNVRLYRVNGSEVVVIQAIKDVQQGQELLLWFDEEILMDEMEIPPYLSPANIRGGNSYTCHLCGRTFEAPNKLKIHIALKCDSMPSTVLWRRLIASSKTPPRTTTTTPKPCLKSTIWSPLIPSTISSTSIIQTPPLLKILINPQPRPQHFLSLSHPISSIPRTSTVVTTSTPPLQFSRNSVDNNNRPPRPKLIKSRVSNNGIQYQHKRCLNPSVEKTITVSDPEAQLESIVSNMGKARNGHMCLYCGKLYSRKYGLKIHIRTHTGYKPLQCRICHRPFGDPSNLNKHIRLHSDGNTPYRCDICHKVLVRKRDLERHIRSRHTNHSLPVPIPEGMVLEVRTPASV